MMDAQWWWRTFYIGLTCLAIISADEKCGGGCKGVSGDSVFSFEEGTVYRYEVEGLSVTQLVGSSNDASKLSIKASAIVSAESQCTYVLKLANVQVAGTDGKQYDDLTAGCLKPVKFTLNNGELNPEICTEKDDVGAALNIKRAVISLFQSSNAAIYGSDRKFSYETDVFGSCPTTYLFSSTGSKVQVTKSRNLNRCANREKFDFPVLSTPYYTYRSDFQTSPLMLANLEVSQEIESGILKSAIGGEKYEYRPILTADAIATISNKFAIRFIGAGKGSIPASGNVKQSIIFETPHPSDGAGSADAIIKALQKVVSEIDPAVEQSAANSFLELVDELEHASKANILTVYSQIKSGAGFRNKDDAKNLLLDGLLFAGSAESVEAAAELLHSNEISEEGSLKWYLDLNFVKHVSKGSIKAVTPLLEGKPPHQAYLGIGALAGKYCRQHDCASVPEFQQLLQKLAKPVIDGCRVNSVEEENNVIASLKGLANVQVLTPNVAIKLSQCAEDTNVRTRIRSAALSAYRENPVLKKSAIKIFKDVDEDAELRIKAYLALVEKSYPCGEVADVVKESIDKEPVNQVGSYIVSHLRNLRATTNPNKETAKYCLGQIIPKKRFPFDVRKFSHNRELSYSFDALNVGAVGEADTIYSQKSYLPRYVSLNLTSNIFGHSFNFLEVAARAENLEYLVEKYFGPNGQFNKSPNDVVEDTAEAGEHYYGQYKNSLRNKRSVSQQQINNVAKKVKLGVDYEDRSIDIDLSLKLFGAEVGWLKLNGDKSSSLENLLSKVNGRFEESVNKLKNYEVDYKKGRTFLDATVSYPTVFGLALKVKVLGGSAANIKVDSKLNIKEIIEAIKNKNTDLNTDIKLQVIPSVAVELTSLIAIDADIIQTGVKATANLHSSTGTDITLRILDGSGVDLKVGLPVKNQELVSFKTNVVSVVRERGHKESSSKITFNTQRTKYGGCFDQLSPFIGLTFCGEIDVPAEKYLALSPAYGPSTVVLRVEKEDESISSYHFKAYYNDKDPHARSLEVILDTPNSQSDRKLALVIQARNEPRLELSVSALSPWKRVSLEGFVTDTNSEQSITAKLINDDQVYSLKAGATVSGDENRKKYEPLLEYKEPEGGKQWALVGRKGGVKGGKSQQSLGVTGAVIVEKKPGTKYRKYELKSVTVTTQVVKFTVDGDVIIDKNSLETDLTVSYDKNSVKLNSKLQCTGNKIIAEVDFIPEQSKELSASLKWNFEKEKHKIANSIVLVHGPDLKSEEAKFSLSQSLEYNFESYKNFEFETKNSLSYPLLKVIGKFDLEVSPKEIDFDFKAGYDVFNVESCLEAKTGIKDVGDYNVEFSAKFLDSNVQLTAKHDIISDVKSKFTNSLELKPGGKYQLNAIVVYDFKGKDINQAIEAEVKIPFEPKIIKLSTALKNNKAESSVVFILIGGGKPIIEIKGSLEKSNKPEGNFKVYIPNYIDSSGSYSFDGHKGVGSFSLEFPKTSRQVAGKGEVYITGSHYKGFGEVQWDAKKNPSKKIRVDTDTSYSENSIDSKNALQILDYKTVVNVKGSLQGKLSDGTLVGETELGLPSGRILTFKINRELHLKPGDNEIEGTYELCNYDSKGSQPQKLVFKISGKNIDPKKVSFDGQADLTYTTQKQENVILHVVGKKVPQGDKWIIAGEGSISGSLVHAVKVKLNSEVSDLFLKGDFSNKSQLPPAQYDLTASDAASGITISVNGKVNGYQFNNDLDLKLPSDFPITSLKWTTVNFLNYHPEEGQLKQVKYNNAVTWNGNKFVKVNVEASSDTKDLNSYGKLEWESHVASLRTLTGRIKKEEGDGTVTVNLEGAFTFEGKTADINVKLVDLGRNTIHAYVVANVPSKGKFTADLKTKEERPSETVYIRDFVLVLTGDDKTYTITHHLENHQSDLFLLKFLVEAPQGKSGVDIKSVKKGLRKYEIREKFYWISGGGGNLDLDVDFDFGDLKDISFKIYADSKKLSIKQFEFEGTCKAAVKTSGKRLVFSAKSADSELFSGSLLYQVEDKLPSSLSFDGNGVLRVRGETYPLKVDLDYGYSLAESTFVLSVDAKPYSWLSQIKRENPEQILVNFDVLHKFCRDTVCSKVELGQKFEEDKENFSSFTIDRHLYIDLDALIYESKTISYKSSYKQQGPYFDNKVISSYGTYTSEYHSYVKEQEAGAVLTLPSRVIALEISHDIVQSKKSKSLPGAFEIAFYPNKKNPEEKTCLSFKSDVSKFLDNEATGPFNTELRFAAPGIRDLILKVNGEVSKDYGTVEGTVDIDVFNKKPNRIVIDYKRTTKQAKNDLSFDQTLKVHSKGQEIDFQSHQTLQISKENVIFHSIAHYLDAKKVKQEGQFKLEANEDNQVLYVKIPEGVLVSAIGKTTKTKDGESADYNYEFLGKKVSEKIVFNKNNVKYIAHYGKDVFVGEFGFAYGQMAEYKASLNNKLLAGFEVKLDDVNFLKSTYSYDVDTIKALIESVKSYDLELYGDYAKVSKAAIERISNELADRSEELRKASPNFKPVLNAYAAQWKKLKEELEDDESFKETITAFKKVRGVVIDQIIEVYQETSKALNSLFEVINESWQSINEVLKKIIPKFSDAFGRVTDTVKLLIEEFYKVTSQTLNCILDEIKKHDEEVKEAIALVADIVHELGIFISRSTQQIQDEVKDLLIAFKEQCEALPIIAIIKDKAEELRQYQLPDHVLAMYSEFVGVAKQSAPTQETQILIDCVATYIEKILKHQPVDDKAELEQIYKNLVAAVRSVVALYNPKNPDAPFDPLYELIDNRIFRPLQLYHPTRGAFRLNLIQILQSPDLPSLSELYQTYKPTRYILDYFPPYTAYATFTDSTEIVTFDGQQLSFKGSCGYILVQDYVDGNFSVVASLENGKVKALVISDRDNIVEIHSDTSVVVNGKPNEFPVIAGDITVWRKYHSFGAYVNGLRILCVDNLEHCNFILSGFYFSKTRGLLGTYNNEPYDDLSAPAGNICGSSSEFGNAWKTNDQCSDVPQVVHNHVHVDDCTEYFTTGSPLQSCFSAVDPLSYRKSCDHNVQESQGNKQEVLCKFVRSYVGTCLIRGISVKLPNDCYSCKAGSHTLKPGEKVSINTPKNSADIVIVVEELEFNEEVYASLILPLIPHLTNDLKGRGITDVKFALIGFGAPGNDWPAHYTTNGEIQFNGKSKISFGKLENNTSRGELVEKIRFLKKQFDIEFGLTPFSKVIEEIMYYPFRAEAVKSVLSVYAKPCEKSSLPISTVPIKSFAGSIAVKHSGIKLNVITPLKDLEIEGKVPKAAANIVGFDSEAVYMQGEAKRKVLRGDEETFKNLKYSDDGCIDFAQSVDGAVFSSNNFIQGKPGLRKNFLQVLSEKITEDLTGVVIEQECWCELERFFPITRCKVESRREKEILAKTIKGGVKG